MDTSVLPGKLPGVFFFRAVGFASFAGTKSASTF
jgi:hypothetical protein